MSRFLDEVEACVPALRRYARALTRDRDRADDLVQDCLERALRKRMLWRPTGSLRSWLFRILLNIYRNQQRSERRAPFDLAVGGAPMRFEPREEAAGPGRLALAETARAIAMLPDDQRHALLLVALEGLSYAEAAAALEVPVGTLMSRLGRARATLRRLTEGEPRKLRSVP